jgi:hypothetical protein
MLHELAFKPDFAKTIDRFEAWWLGQIIDRPPVSLGVKPHRPYEGPQSHHATLRDRWLDAEFQVHSAIAEMQRWDYVGDDFPVFYSNVGPEITATLYGCNLEFTERSSWSSPVVLAPQGPDGWQRIANMPPDFTNPYWRCVERATDLALELCAGRYAVGFTDLHGTYDILAGLRDPQDLCLDLLDCPDLVAAAAANVTHGYVAAFERQAQRLFPAGQGSTTWCPIIHDGPAYIPSCDFWCMVSPQIAREMIVPTIVTEMKPMQRALFHLDGVDALRHLDLMLELPGLNAVQWVYGAGRGPAARWIELYQRIQAAGKGVQVCAQSPEDALAVLAALQPEGVWLDVGGQFASVAEAEAFLREVESRAVRR